MKFRKLVWYTLLGVLGVVKLAEAASVRLTWNFSQNPEPATGFVIERCMGSTCTNFSLLTPIPLAVSQRSYVDSERLVPGRTYRWRIQSVSGTRISQYSLMVKVTIPTDATPLSVPTGVAGAVHTGIDLAWDAPKLADGTLHPAVTGYTLYVGPKSGTYESTFAVGAGTTYRLPTLPPGQLTFFTVTASTQTGEESPFSNEISLTTPGTPSTGSLIPQQSLRVVSVDSEETVGENNAAVNAFDGLIPTMWHTKWFEVDPVHPHMIVLDLGSLYQVDGWQYLPRQGSGTNGTIATYELSVSQDGTTWGEPVSAGRLVNNTLEKTIRFAPKAGRYVRLVALSEIKGEPYTSAAELRFFGTSTPLPARAMKR